MPLFSSIRSRRLAERAAAAFDEGGFGAAAALLEEGRALGGRPWAVLAVLLYNDGHKEAAERAVRRALEVEPDRGDALILLAELLAESDRTEEAIATYRRVLARFPAAAAEALALAKLLATQGDFGAAGAVLEPFAALPSHEIRIMLAKVAYELGDHQKVLALLAPVVQQMKLELQGAIYGMARTTLVADYNELLALHDDAYAALHGREQVIETAAARGDLDAKAGVNYRLLGEARMARPAEWAPDTRLRSVDEGLAFGESLLANERSRGLCHLGASRMRQGRLDEARKLFEQARSADDGSFVAYLGLGAVLDLERTGVFERLRELPEPAALPPAFEEVMVDWPVLTADERRVVSLLTAPLAGLLPRIAAAGAFVRILPIDTRLTDLPEMAAAPDERFEDHRCLEAITGAANDRVCASKVEDLLNVMGEADSVFAHELAHLAHHHAPEEVQRGIDQLYDRAMKTEHAVTTYQTTNPAEFFAVAYTDFVAHEHDLPSRRELDDEGIIEETFAFIRRLR